jgi:hypothetical protein
MIMGLLWGSEGQLWLQHRFRREGVCVPSPPVLREGKGWRGGHGTGESAIHGNLAADGGGRDRGKTTLLNICGVPGWLLPIWLFNT